MKTNQNLISTLSFKALAAKARRAAAVAATTKLQSVDKAAKSTKKTKSLQKQLPAIEREIRAIFNSLSSSDSETYTVVLEHPERSASAKAIVKVFLKVDIERQREEETAYREAIAAGVDRSTLPRCFVATPIVMYAFYPKTTDEDTLGSIAIYGKNASQTLDRIVRHGYLFGRTVLQASVEIGRRPFVNVIIAA